MEIPNLSKINELAGDDLEFKKQLIAVICKEFPNEKQFYEDCVAKKDYKKTAEIVHKLKHKISILDLEEGYKTAVTYENSLRESGSLSQKEFENTLQTISTFLETLKKMV